MTANGQNNKVEQNHTELSQKQAPNVPTPSRSSEVLVDLSDLELSQQVSQSVFSEDKCGHL